MDKEDWMKRKNELIERAKHILQARVEYPGMNISEAFKLYCQNHNLNYENLTTEETNVMNKFEEEHRTKKLAKKCTKENCTGYMILEAVCGGCVEGKAGYKSKWTCTKCMHRELSKETVEHWIYNQS